MNQVSNQTNISVYFHQDHDRLDHAFRQFQKLKNSDFSQARAFFVVFKFGLQRHIVWEEEILFPLFERKTGILSTSPTFVMRDEHKRIGAFLEAIHEKVKAGDPNTEVEETNLLNVLSIHNRKEEM